MGIPKMKLYRLDQNYSPDTDSDIQSVQADELLPVVQKSLDLSDFETLTGIVPRDLMVGSEGAVRLTSTILVSVNPSGRIETEYVCCDGWMHGRSMIEAYAVSEEVPLGTQIPEDCYRLVYKTERAMLDNMGQVTENAADAAYVRQMDFLKLELGKKYDWLESTEETVYPDKSTITGIIFRYCLFRNNFLEALALQRGYIYDGTETGYIGKRTEDGRYVTEKDDTGKFPLKAEGNEGYRALLYPCRQKVIHSATGSDFAYIGDIEMTDGRFSISGCEKWIVARTDERSPHLFELLENAEGKYFHQLEENVQYVCSVSSDDEGRVTLTYSLSEKYYSIDTGTVLFPQELFLRYNEETDLLGELLIPDYLSFDSKGKRTGDSGKLSANEGFSPTEVGMRVFRSALPVSEAREDDLRITSEGGSLTISIPENAVDVRIYRNGILIFEAETMLSNEWYSEISVFSNVVSLTENSSVETRHLLLSWTEKHPVSMDLRSPWAFGYRLCCWEKSKEADLYVSPFRNWVSEHLNNNPDLFYGWVPEYEGSKQNTSPTIAYYPGEFTTLETGCSILYREGAVQFKDIVDNNTIDDVLNFEWSAAEKESTLNEILSSGGLRQVYAKFAYYDSIRSLTNALFREVSIEDGISSYEILEDPMQSAYASRRWVTRQSSDMPFTFFSNNRYLPDTVHSELEQCYPWEEYRMTDGDVIVINPSDYRVVALRNFVNAPDTEGQDGEEVLRKWRIFLDAELETGKTDSYSGSGAAFYAQTRFQYIVGEEESGWETLYEKLFQASGSSGTEVLGSIVSPEFDENATLSEIYSSRTGSRYLYQTGDSIPYNVAFEPGEQCLLVYAVRK